MIHSSNSQYLRTYKTANDATNLQCALIHIPRDDVVCRLNCMIVNGNIWPVFVLTGHLQRKFFISINELWLYQITIYVIKSLSKIK